MVVFPGCILLKDGFPSDVLGKIVRKKSAHFEKKVPNFGEKDIFFQNVLTIFCSISVCIYCRLAEYVQSI